MNALFFAATPVSVQPDVWRIATVVLLAALVFISSVSVFFQFKHRGQTRRLTQEADQVRERLTRSEGHRHEG